MERGQVRLDRKRTGDFCDWLRHPAEAAVSVLVFNARHGTSRGSPQPSNGRVTHAVDSAKGSASPRRPGAAASACCSRTAWACGRTVRRARGSLAARVRQLDDGAARPLPSRSGRPGSPCRGRAQVQVRLVEHLHQGAPGVDALDDRNPVDHAAGTTIPLSKYEHVTSAEGADCLLKLGPVLDALARPVSWKTRSQPSATNAPS